MRQREAMSAACWMQHAAAGGVAAIGKAEVGLGGRGATIDNVQALGLSWEDVNASGGCFTVGGGIYAYFTETLALEVDLKFSSGQFQEIHLGGISLSDLDIDAQTSRFKVGVVWWP